MKKVLILAYDFPPYVSVGGLRPFNWFRYLKEYGVEPTVITRQWNNTHGNYLDYISKGVSDESLIEKSEFGTIIKTPYKPNLANRLMLKYGEKKYRFLRKSISAFYEFGQFIWITGPKAGIFKEARSYLKNNQVDIIIATGDPFVLFYYASKLGKEFNIPWIADYRDPWSHNQEYSEKKLLKKWNAHFEKKLVSTASHITTVSSFVHSKIDSLIPNKSFSILPNGYDPSIIDRVQKIPQNSKNLTIAFVGTIYNWHPLESFLRTVQKFILQGKIINIKFYGTNIANELNLIIEKKFPELKSIISITPKITNEELLKKIVEDNVMLLFNYYSYMGTKIFDYLGIRRKMILCYSNDPEANELKSKYYSIDESMAKSKQLQADLITETNSGIIVKDSNHLMSVLHDLYNEFEKNKSIACNSTGVENYSRKIQVEILANLLKKIKI